MAASEIVEPKHLEDATVRGEVLVRRDDLGDPRLVRGLERRCQAVRFGLVRAEHPEPGHAQRTGLDRRHGRSAGRARGRPAGRAVNQSRRHCATVAR